MQPFYYTSEDRKWCNWLATGAQRPRKEHTTERWWFFFLIWFCPSVHFLYLLSSLWSWWAGAYTVCPSWLWARDMVLHVLTASQLLGNIQMDRYSHSPSLYTKECSMNPTDMFLEYRSMPDLRFALSTTGKNAHHSPNVHKIDLAWRWSTPSPPWTPWSLLTSPGPSTSLESSRRRSSGCSGKTENICQKLLMAFYARPLAKAVWKMDSFYIIRFLFNFIYSYWKWKRTLELHPIFIVSAPHYDNEAFLFYSTVFRFKLLFIYTYIKK